MIIYVNKRDPCQCLGGIFLSGFSDTNKYQLNAYYGGLSIPPLLMLLIEINGKHCILWQTTVLYWLSISPNPCCCCKLKWQIHNLCSMCFVSADYWKIVLYSSILHEPALQRPLCTVWIPSSHSCTAFYKLSPKCCSKFSSICVNLLFQVYMYMLNPLKTQLSFRNIRQNTWLYSMCLTAYSFIPIVLQLCLRVFPIAVSQVFQCWTACQTIKKNLLCHSQAFPNVLLVSNWLGTMYATF